MGRRIPAWIHPQAAGRTLDKLQLRPGYPAGSGARRLVPVSITRFRTQVTGVSLAGAQAQATVNSAGTATCKVGPQGLGVTWYPSSVVVSTSVGATDAATAACYVGSIAAMNLQGGQSYAGGGDTIGLSVQTMTPGDLLIVVWTGATPGSTATMNVVGTQDVLSY
jgi:hypothetical protein